LFIVKKNSKLVLTIFTTKIRLWQNANRTLAPLDYPGTKNIGTKCNFIKTTVFTLMHGYGVKNWFKNEQLSIRVECRFCGVHFCGYAMCIW